MTAGQSPPKQGPLDVLVSSPSPSLAKQIHAGPQSVGKPSHCSVSSTGDLDLVTSAFMDLINIIKQESTEIKHFIMQVWEDSKDNIYCFAVGASLYFLNI